MIALADYWMGRDAAYPQDLTGEIEANAEELLRRVNKLLAEFGEARAVRSGWRPPAVNEATAGAAPRSKHMTGQAIDLDDPEGDLDEWCFARPDRLEALGLFQEHPGATKSWTHLQSVPPRSGNRVFWP